VPPRPLDRVPIALAPGWLAAAAALVAFAVWLAQIPPSLSSDDAFFLLHSLTRFSILDFSPPFPGYPGYVAMGHVALLVMHDPLAALALTSGAVALAIPPAAAWLTWRIIGAGGAALAAFFLTLLGPLMPDVAVSLLTDGAGILFLLVALALLPKQHEPVRLRLVLAGLALGWAFACRPSDAPLFAGAFLAIAVTRPRWIATVVLGAAAVLIPAAAILYAREGSLYWEEGLRFVSGHALIWGNTPLAVGPHESWLTILATVPFALPIAVFILAGLVAAARLPARPPVLVAALAAFAAHLVWVVAFQNPDHLRHLAPLLALGGVLFVCGMAASELRRVRLPAPALFAAAEIAALAASGALTAPGKLSPLAAAEVWLAARSPAAVLTNEGVFMLRGSLPETRVYDAHYAGDALLGLASGGPAFRLTGTPRAIEVPTETFPARFPGERPLYLYAAP
jgi:hypothetical protein